MSERVTISSPSTLALAGGSPVRSSFLPFHQPLVDADDERAVLETLRSGWLTTGPRTKAFEKELAAYTGAAHCVGVNSCTAALHLALEAVGVGPGDEVITSPITFASTANVIVHRGAQPVFVDVAPDTFNIDAAAIERAVTPRTKALIPVDFAGHPCDLDAIMSIGARHGIPVIEDAAHAIGAQYKGRPIGGIADMTCFSFYATKNITSGEGGALTTNRQEWADRISVMALHGISRDAWKRYGTEGYKHWDIIAPGYKYNMFDIQASLVRSQMNKMDAFHKRRVALKQRLDTGLSDCSEIALPSERADVVHAYHLYPILVRPERLSADRDTIMNAIQAENIGIGIHFRAVHLHPFYADTFGFRRGMFPVAEAYSDQTISLPLYPRMTDQDADDTVAAVRKVLAHYRR
ncbi:MAG: DegT/DnrJ/EryC1/StrS aminotransferase family protein [Acidobacteria bacterium]|nr:DegT/DnrJ/EryC1/StrS aminotransferase family protein [Acidobacteriota bacterium]